MTGLAAGKAEGREVPVLVAAALDIVLIRVAVEGGGKV
jgi:hypothetical protein